MNCPHCKAIGSMIPDFDHYIATKQLAVKCNICSERVYETPGLSLDQDREIKSASRKQKKGLRICKRKESDKFISQIAISHCSPRCSNLDKKKIQKEEA